MMVMVKTMMLLFLFENKFGHQVGIIMHNLPPPPPERPPGSSETTTKTQKSSRGQLSRKITKNNRTVRWKSGGVAHPCTSLCLPRHPLGSHKDSFKKIQIWNRFVWCFSKIDEKSIFEKDMPKTVRLFSKNQRVSLVVWLHQKIEKFENPCFFALSPAGSFWLRQKIAKCYRTLQFSGFAKKGRSKLAWVLVCMHVDWKACMVLLYAQLD